jgi:uncharacterized membrane protein
LCYDACPFNYVADDYSLTCKIGQAKSTLISTIIGSLVLLVLVIAGVYIVIRDLRKNKEENHKAEMNKTEDQLSLPKVTLFEISQA